MRHPHTLVSSLFGSMRFRSVPSLRRGRLVPYGLEEECYDWHTCVRYYKRTLWHSLTTACIATDANSQSVNRLYLHGPSLTSINDSSKSTSLTVRRSAYSRLSIPFVPSYMLCNSCTRSRVLALGNAKGAAARLPT